ncbi:copper resistance protein NlpE [Chitinophaga sp. 22321]|uniref:Copper resistance protein NlpE N-terminal domain-containing protein n=1 Tax=Chitinophaga hostae TaxID=2831022 RepID=A0ABS5ISP9_9BACT|nr:copper resistance protein NlpE [Chitinophaga hostae]MBS0025976.1 copper resistance protein NlpE N-terminal domain-containing protein [Chitinophaga hostae]
MKYLPLLLICTVLAACQHKGSSGVADNPDNVAGTDTATWVTYSGTLPCADCEGIITELSLHRPPDTQFKMTETYQGKNQTLRSEGTYSIVHGIPSDPGATMILINPEKDKNLQRYLQQVDEHELKLLDSDQKTIESNLNYTLKKVL